VILGGHSALFAPPELFLLAFNDLQERARNLQGRTGFLGQGVPRALKELIGQDNEAVLTKLGEFENREMTVAAFYSELFGHLDGRMLVDKTPSYSFRSDVLDRAEHMFDKPLYIHLLRDPFSTVSSMAAFDLDSMIGLKSQGHSDYHDRFRCLESLWTETQLDITGFLEKIPAERKTRVRFEDLLWTPESTVSGLCRFLGVPFLPAMLNPYSTSEGDRMIDGFEKNSAMLGDPNFLQFTTIDSTVTDRWEDSRDEVQLRDRTQELAAHLGYEEGARLGTRGKMIL